MAKKVIFIDFMIEPTIFKFLWKQPFLSNFQSNKYQIYILVTINPAITRYTKLFRWELIFGGYIKMPYQMLPKVNCKLSNLNAPIKLFIYLVKNETDFVFEHPDTQVWD